MDKIYMHYEQTNLRWAISSEYLIFWAVVFSITYVFWLRFLKHFNGRAYIILKKWLYVTFTSQLVFFIFHFTVYSFNVVTIRFQILWFLLSSIEVIGVGFALLMVLYGTGPMVYYGFTLRQYGKEAAQSKLTDYSDRLQKHPFKDALFAFFFILFFIGLLIFQYIFPYFVT